SWRIGVVFEKFRRTMPVKAEVEPSIQTFLAAVPALANERSEGAGYLQPIEKRFVVDRAIDELQTHRIDFPRRRLDLVFDLLQGEGVKRPLVPVAFAADAVKFKTRRGSSRPPVLTFFAGNALHGAVLTAAMAAGLDGRFGHLIFRHKRKQTRTDISSLHAAPMMAALASGKMRGDGARKSAKSAAR